MKQIDKIIESQEAPKDKNVLWIKGDKLLSHVNGKWSPVGGGSASTKNQDKSVEIVENGVTEVTADSGYTGLGKVTINANVPQSGGSGGGESGGSTLEYIDLRNVTGAAAGSVLMGACHFKVIITVNDTEVLKSAGFSTTMYEEMAGGLGGKINYIAAAIDFSQKITMNMNGQNRVVTVADTCIENGATQEQLDALTRLTKEEYYNLEA